MKIVCLPFTPLVLAKVREALYAKGMLGMRGITRVFKHFDYYKGQRRVTKQDLYAGLKELGVNITKQEAMQLMNYLDKNGEGYVNYEEFLAGLRVKTGIIVGEHE